MHSMNKHDRDKIGKETRRFVHDVRAAATAYRAAMERVRDAEEEKRGNLPENLAESVLAESICQASDDISDVLGKVDEIEEACVEIMDTLEVSPTGLMAGKRAPRSEGDRRRTKQLHLITSPAMDEDMRALANRLGKSLNQVAEDAFNLLLESQ